MCLGAGFKIVTLNPFDHHYIQVEVLYLEYSKDLRDYPIFYKFFYCDDQDDCQIFGSENGYYLDVLLNYYDNMIATIEVSKLASRLTGPSNLAFSVAYSAYLNLKTRTILRIFEHINDEKEEDLTFGIFSNSDTIKNNLTEIFLDIAGANEKDDQENKESPDESKQ